MRHFKLFIACMLMVVFGIGQVWADTEATLSISSKPSSSSETLTDDQSNEWAFTSDGTVSGSETNLIHVGTNSSQVSYIQLVSTGLSSNSISEIHVWAAAKASTNVTIKIYIGENLLGTSSVLGNTSSSGGTEFSVNNTDNYSGEVKILVSRPSKANGAIYFNSATVTYTTGGGGSDPSLSASPATIDFGTVYKDASVEDKAVAVTFANLTGSVSYSGLTSPFTASGTISATGDEITIAANTETAGTYSQTLTVQSVDDSKSAEVTVKMKVVAPLTPISGGIIDELTISDLGVSSTSYTAFTDKQASNTDHSNAVYAGKVACNSSTNIQMNTIGTGNSAGRSIATTTSGGYAKRVHAVWGGTNTADRKLTVYGSESAYTGSETATSGTKLGDLTYATGDTYAYIDIDGDYPYIQIVASGAMYMSQINITWLSNAAAVAKPTISGDENFLTSTEVEITCGTTGATIYYTDDDTDPKTSATKKTYSAAFELSETKKIRAIANLGSDWSTEATSKTFTKIATWTVAEANTALASSSPQNGKYVRGIVSQVDAFASNAITYWISDDGSTTGQLEVYKGKNLNNTNFTAITDLEVGDNVIVYGDLTIYKGTNEFSQGNYLVLKQDPAVATPVFAPNGGGFMGETDVTITCATASSTIYYTLDGSAPSKSSTLYEGAIHLTETKTITAIAYVGDEHSIVVAKTFTYTSPMTVAEALTALDSENPINNAAVTGIISTAPSSNPSSGKLTYYISDDGTTTSELEVFNGFGLNGAAFSAKTDLQEGDQVTVFGNLKIYSGSSGDVKEFDTGSRLLAFNRPTVAVTGVQLEATASVKVGKTVALTAEVQPGNATNKNVSWRVKSGSDYASVADGVVTGIAEGEAVIEVKTEDGEFTAECTVTVSEAITFDNAGYEWQLVTSDAQLVAGKYYVLGSASKNVVAGDISNDVLSTVAAVCTDGVIAYNAFGTEQTADAADVVVFELGGTSSAWTLNELVNDLGLLGYKGNKTVKWGGEATTWTIAIADNNATMVPVDANTYHMLYNVNNPRFTVYTSDPAASMLLPQLYVWAEKTNKLKYDANGGSNAPSAQPAVAGKATVTDAKPTAPENKVFDRWNTTATGDGLDKAAGDEIDLSAGDVTLFAQWRDPASFNIIYDANGGTVIDGKTEIDPENITEGTQYTVKVNVYEKEGKVFTGWKAGETVYNAGDKLYPAANMTFVAQWSDPNISDFILVTDLSQLQDGDKVYIVADGNYSFAAGSQNSSNYREKVEIGKTADKTRVIISGTAPFEFELGISGHKITLKDGEKYLSATSAKSVTLSDDSFEWTLTIDENGTVIDAGTAGTLQYNASSPRFAAYTSTQKPVVLYKKANYVREMNPGRYGTICVPNSGTIFGAILYEVAYYDAGQQKIFFDEVLNGLLEAGKPYIFQEDGTVSKLGIVFSGTENKAVGEYKNNGLVGYIGADAEAWTQVPDDEDCYIIQNNQYRQVLAGADARIKSNRAYIKMSEVPTTASPIQPNRRRISMSGQGGQVATGVENGELLNGANGVQKVLINGELFILQGEKMYNASGVRVK